MPQWRRRTPGRPLQRVSAATCALCSLGITEETIVLFTSDHGNHFKTRNAEYTRSCHDVSIRVPTALCGPGFDGGGQVQELVSLIDLPPTLLNAAAIDVPDTMQGRPLLPLLNNQLEDEWPEEMFVQISESHDGRCVRTKRWKYSVRASENATIQNGMADRYVEDFLYDLQADPYELNNLISYESHREVTAKMQERLLRRMQEAGEPQPKIEPAATRLPGQYKVADHEVSM